MTRGEDHSLLIVDDDEAVLRGMTRFLRLHFSSVLTASEPAQAEALLAECAPPLLVCDYWLGYNWPLGTVLIADWRQRFPSLRRVALMTGTRPESLQLPEVVDAIFPKPLNMQELLAFLKPD